MQIPNESAEIPEQASAHLRPLVVGEAPGRVPGAVLRGRCGKVLADLVGIDVEEFHRRVEAINLLVEWPGPAASKGAAGNMKQARAAAEKFDLRGRFVVFLGRRVAEAFGFREPHWFEWRLHRGGIAAIMPHPSGVNTWWNDRRNTRHAARFMTELIGKEGDDQHGD